MSEIIKQEVEPEISVKERMARIFLAVTFALAGIYGCRQAIEIAAAKEEQLVEDCGEDRSGCLTEEVLVCSGLFTGNPTCEESFRYVTVTPNAQTGE